MAGYIVLGMGFGILMSAKGYGVLWAIAAGIIIYSGTMQFAAAEMFTGGAALTEAAMTALMMGARHIFYGLTMSERYKNIHGLKKAYMIFSLTDETYSLVCESDDGDYCFWVSLFDHIYWVTGGVIGSLLGEILRLADDVNGYGPQGKNFIAHVSIPKGVRSAFEEVSKFYDVRKAKP